MSKISGNTVRVLELDGIRGTAILIVLIFHWIVLEGGSGIFPQIIYNLGQFGWSGVDLFFVLSGFLIGGNLIDVKDSKNYYKVFYMRRFCRILPLYFVVLVLAAVIYYSSLPPESHKWLFGSILPWQSYLIFVQNFAMAIKNSMGSKVIDATWSLAIEEQFYLTLPFVVRFFRKEYLPYIFLTGIILAPIIRIGIYLALGSERSGVANYVLPFCRMDALFLGALGAWLIRHPRKEIVLQKFPASGVYCILFILSAGFFVLANRQLGFSSFILISFGYTWIAFFYFSLLWIALTRKASWIAAIFRLRLLTLFGTLAYGLYLFHQPILGVMHGIIRHSSPYVTDPFAFLVTSCALVCLLGLAYLSWTYFEKPIVKFGHKYKYQY
jgi:peptidoglycan/LPS O-acetylase OafA/YrhL